MYTYKERSQSILKKNINESLNLSEEIIDNAIALCNKTFGVLRGETRRALIRACIMHIAKQNKIDLSEEKLCEHFGFRKQRFYELGLIKLNNISDPMKNIVDETINLDDIIIEITI